MFDIKWIRDNAAAFDASLKRRGLEPLSGKLIELDEARRAHVTKLQDAQARRNAASKEIGKAKASKDEAGAAKLMAEVATLKEVIQAGEDEERQVNAALEKALAVIPNLPLAEVPDGKDEHDNKMRPQGRQAEDVRLQAQAALRDRRGAGPHGLRDGGQDFRRAVRVPEGRAGAAGAGDRPRSCSTCTRVRRRVNSAATPRTTRRCWSRTTPPTAPATFRSLRRICSRYRPSLDDARTC